MKILAFLQCQWVKDPARVQAIYDRHGDDPDARAKLNARFLFYRSLTGRRLRAAFGTELCEEIVWEEASKRKAGESSGVFHADAGHMADCIIHHRPDVVMTFGNVAASGLTEAEKRLRLSGQLWCDYPILHCPHPAARMVGVTSSLRWMADGLRRLKEREAANA